MDETIGKRGQKKTANNVDAIINNFFKVCNEHGKENARTTVTNATRRDNSPTETNGRQRNANGKTKINVTRHDV